MHHTDTIAAISTPHGSGGIGVIRISGSDALAVAGKVFRAADGGKVQEQPSHTVRFGRIVADGRVVDEALLTVMRAPRTYTREDVAEISCHGGTVAVRDTLAAVLNAGARLAEPGEFTKRAFLNGRMDLAEAEAVMDVITSTTSSSRQVAVNQLGGALSEEIDAIRNQLLALISHVQALCDFPEEGLEPLSEEEFAYQLEGVRERLSRLLATSSQGAALRDGVSTVIAGKPNVGKSSLLNLLEGSDRAIVTEIAGTTRDAIEAYVSLGAVPLRLLDTAGVRETDDMVERMGVEKARALMETAQLILLVLDGQRPLDEQDEALFDLLAGKNVIALINKSENGMQVDETAVRARFEHTIVFSVKTRMGLEALTQTVEQMYGLGRLDADDTPMLTNVRHMDAVRRALAQVQEAQATLGAGLGADMTFIDLEGALDALGEVPGLTVGEEIVDRIFHAFCVGK